MLKGSLIESDNPKVAAAMNEIHSSDRDMVQSGDMRKTFGLIGAAYVVFMTSWVVPLACVSTVTVMLPLILLSPRLFNYLEHKLCGMVNAHWSSCASTCGAQITEYGTNIAEYAEEKCMLLANHLGLLDHFVLMQSLNDKGSVRSRWMWVIYNIWKYTPLGVMWTTHGNFFVNGGASKKEKVLTSFRDHIKNNYYKYDYGWIIMYPEGSRFYLVQNSGRSFAQKMGLKPLENCVYPRTGAAHAVLATLGPKPGDNTISNCEGGAPIKYIIDATIGYSGGVVPNVGNAAMGEWPTADSSKFAVHYDVIPVKEEWSNEEKLRDFLNERYILKDKILADFYKTGSFPGAKREVQLNFYEMAFSQFFWIALYYTHYYIWLRPSFNFVLSALVSLFM